jgi:hypothetical protein
VFLVLLSAASRRQADLEDDYDNFLSLPFAF